MKIVLFRLAVCCIMLFGASLLFSLNVYFLYQPKIFLFVTAIYGAFYSLVFWPDLKNSNSVSFLKTGYLSLWTSVSVVLLFAIESGITNYISENPNNMEMLGRTVQIAIMGPVYSICIYVFIFKIPALRKIQASN